MQKIRVVLFSRFRMVRSGIRLLLSSANDVEIIAEVATAQEVERAIQQLHPNLVLAETNVISDPAFSAVMAKVRHENAAVIVLANEADAEAVRAMFRAGVTGVVLKQSSGEELLLAIHSAGLGRRFLDASLLDEITFEVHSSKKKKTKELLSKRESQVLAKLVQGYTSLEIAKEFHLTVKTIETYRARIYEKLKLRSRADLVRYAMSAGLISVDKQRLV